ncbi:hypothetical protein EV424DRAFT_1353272 [Suillus variegatus]|nr:hypothetical protein EV424DRAFT_1353272 [Suillus variegatus]
MSRPNAEICLQAYLGNSYSATDWEPTLKVIMEEEDGDEALKTITSLKKAALCHSGLKIHIPSLNDLKSQNHIFGVLPTIDELLNPVEEKEVEESLFDSQDLVKQLQTWYIMRLLLQRLPNYMHYWDMYYPPYSYMSSIVFAEHLSVVLDHMLREIFCKGFGTYNLADPIMATQTKFGPLVLGTQTQTSMSPASATDTKWPD